MKQRSEPPRWVHYLIAVVSTLSVVALRFAANNVFQGLSPFFLGTLAVTISAFIGGLWPGLLATTLSTVFGSFLLIDGSRANPSQTMDVVRLQIAGYLTVCTAISLICGALRNSEQEAAKSVLEERQANNQLSSLLNSITDAFFATDRELNLLRFNPSAVHIWSLKESDLGRSVHECLPSEVYAALEPSLRQMLEKSESSTLEWHDLRLDRWFEVRIVPNPDGLFVYFHDVTRRLVHEEDLMRLAMDQERTTALLDSLLENAPIGFAFFDRAYRFEKVNQQLADIDGVAASEHIGRPLREIIPAIAETMEPVIDQVFKTGKAAREIEVSGEVPLGSGRQRHWLMGLYPVTNRHGDVHAVGAIMIEITQRKTVEDRLRESENRFRRMADHAPVMIWLCTPEAKAIWFNQPWLEFRDKGLEDALQEGCFANIHEDDANRLRETYTEAFRNRESFSVEYRTKEKEGDYRWLLAHGSPLILDNGELEHYIVSCVDISDRKAADENLRNVLNNERLARADAERANRLKDEFVATLSHELRTPLTTMLGWTEILKRRPVRQSDLEDGLDAIERSARLQMQLINDLLDMSRISSGKIRLEMEFVELFDLVNAAVEMARPMAEAKKVAFFLVGGVEPLIARLDPNRFQQVMWNLLTNAIKFTPTGGEIHVVLEAEGSEVRISVADTGDGIDPEFLPQVFDRFRQADGSTTRRHGGLGLGLAIAKQLVTLHGGSIEVFSEGKGKGSVFMVALPLVDQAKFLLPDHAPRNGEVALPAKTLAGICVLLVEDDEPSRNLFSRILEDAGAIVIPANSASRARKLLQETAPDVVISDIGMPEEDGYQFIRSIRSLPLEKGGMIPAAALTAFAGADNEKATLESGFQMHLTKPIEADDLIEAVMKLAALAKA